MNDSKLIDLLGGTGEVAKLCDVTVGAVSQWRKSGIPKARLMYLRVVRPDVFKWCASPDLSCAIKTSSDVVSL